jgi:integrase
MHNETGKQQPGNHPENKRTLAPEEVPIIAGQSRYDVLADHDASWSDPAHLSPLARGLHLALRARHDNKLSDPAMLTFLERFANDLPLGDVRAAAREMDAQLHADMLKSGTTWPLDGAASVLEEQVPDPKGPSGAMIWSPVAATPRELARRLNENGVDLPEDTVERRTLALNVLRAKAAGIRDVAAREGGAPIETPSRPAPIVEPEVEDDPIPTLRGMHDLWKKKMRPGRKAIDDNLLYVGRFIAMNGDLRVDKIKRKHVRTYRGMLEKFPRAQPAALVGKSPDEIVAWAEARPELPRLTPMTINAKGLGAISTLIDIAIAEYDLDGNPCSKLKLPIRDGDQIERLPFDTSDLKRLFLQSTTYWNPPKISKAGCGAAAFWLPLIGLFAGARLEEVGQLLTSDVKTEDGIHYFDFTTTLDEDEVAPAPRRRRGRRSESSEKNLKTPASKRRVPIHQVLIDIGFLNYVARRRANGDSRLFPKLTSYRGRWTKNWSRWWGRYQDKYVSDAPEKVFHSFRHTFVDAMRDVPLEKEFQIALVGHAAERTDVSTQKNTIDSYGKGYPIYVLNEEIQKIAYPDLDLSHLLAIAKLLD